MRRLADALATVFATISDETMSLSLSRPVGSELTDGGELQSLRRRPHLVLPARQSGR